MFREVHEMVVNLCLPSFDGSKRRLDLWYGIRIVALCYRFGCLPSL